MWKRLSDLFIIKTKFEAFLVIYALGAGAVERGLVYLRHYPGWQGWMLFAACTAASTSSSDRQLIASGRGDKPPPHSTNAESTTRRSRSHSGTAWIGTMKVLPSGRSISMTSPAPKFSTAITRPSGAPLVDITDRPSRSA